MRNFFLHERRKKKQRKNYILIKDTPITSTSKVEDRYGKYVLIKDTLIASTSKTISNGVIEGGEDVEDEVEERVDEWIQQT